MAVLNSSAAGAHNVRKQQQLIAYRELLFPLRGEVVCEVAERFELEPSLRGDWAFCEDGTENIDTKSNFGTDPVGSGGLEAENAASARRAVATGKITSAN